MQPDSPWHIDLVLGSSLWAEIKGDQTNLCVQKECKGPRIPLGYCESSLFCRELLGFQVVPGLASTQQCKGNLP